MSQRVNVQTWFTSFDTIFNFLNPSKSQEIETRLGQGAAYVSQEVVNIGGDYSLNSVRAEFTDDSNDITAILEGPKIGVGGGFKMGPVASLGVEGNISSGRIEHSNGRCQIKTALEGPKIGGEAGMKFGTEIGTDGVSRVASVGAIAELSVCKVENTVGPVYGSLGLNANTGFKLGTSGLQVNLLGFGITLGVNNKFGVDTPFGSAGFAAFHTNPNPAKQECCYSQ